MKVRLLVNVTIPVAALVAALMAVALCLAAQKINISGTWVLDKAKSFSNPAGLDQTLTLVHNGDEIKVETKLVIQGKETMVNETWTLDNKEHEFTPTGAAPGTTGKRKAYWLPGGRGIVIEDETPVAAPSGQTTQQTTQRTTRKYTLSTDGTTLTVDYFFDTPRGSYEAKRVFVKRG